MEDEVKITGGIGAFFYASIFWVLAVGALAWLGFASGVVEFHRHLTVAERMDNRVGVREPLQNPVKVVIKAHQGCFSVNRTYADGDTITLYLHNGCSEELMYHEWGWRAKAPDGTVIATKYNNSLEPVEPGSDTEQVMELPDDDRIATIEVWASKDR
jgi:hypothetical protein